MGGMGERKRLLTSAQEDEIRYKERKSDFHSPSKKLFTSEQSASANAECSPRRKKGHCLLGFRQMSSNALLERQVHIKREKWVHTGMQLRAVPLRINDAALKASRNHEATLFPRSAEHRRAPIFAQAALGLTPSFKNGGVKKRNVDLFQRGVSDQKPISTARLQSALLIY